MPFSFKTKQNIEDTASFISEKIFEELQLGKKVLFFLTGGSSIFVGVKISSILKEKLDEKMKENLVIMLTDERYGAVDHTDSNFYQLKNLGFDLPGVKFIPILNGSDKKETVENFNKNLNLEFISAGYKIGLFGIGADGHTAGILPESPALSSEDLVFGYQAKEFYRITITPKAILMLDEAIVWAQGENKKNVLEDFNKEKSIEKQPLQILKRIPLLTIFTDNNLA